MIEDDPLFGLTQADITANLETVGENVRQLVFLRAEEHGMRPADYLMRVLFPRLLADGMEPDQLSAIVGLFRLKSNRQPD